MLATGLHLHHLVLPVLDPRAGILVLDLGFPLLLIEQFDFVTKTGNGFPLFSDGLFPVGDEFLVGRDGLVECGNLAVNSLQTDEFE